VFGGETIRDDGEADTKILALENRVREPTCQSQSVCLLCKHISVSVEL